MSIRYRDGDKHYDVMVKGVTVDTTVTRWAETVDSWIAETEERIAGSQRRRIIGVEAAESAASISSFEPHIATLGMCISNRCLLFQVHLHLLEESSIPQSLHRFLNDPKNTFVAMKSTLSLLKSDCIVEGAVYEDLGFLASKNYNRPELRELGLSELLGVILINAEVGKRPIVLNPTEWDAPELSSDLVESACVDAFLCWKCANLLFKPIPPIARELTPQVDYTFNVLERGIYAYVPRTTLEVEKWILETAGINNNQQRCVGFDMEFFYVDERRRIGTVQFCLAEDTCLIMQFHQMHLHNDTKYLFLPNLVEFLLSHKNIFVGFDVERKMDMLLNMVVFVDRREIPRTVDLGKKAATMYNQPNLNYAGKNQLGRIFLGHRLLEKKPEVGLDWDRPILSRDQLMCACIDAVVPFEISKGIVPLPLDAAS